MSSCWFPSYLPRLLTKSFPTRSASSSRALMLRSSRFNSSFASISCFSMAFSLEPSCERYFSPAFSRANLALLMSANDITFSGTWLLLSLSASSRKLSQSFDWNSKKRVSRADSVPIEHQYLDGRPIGIFQTKTKAGLGCESI